MEFSNRFVTLNLGKTTFACAWHMLLCLIRYAKTSKSFNAWLRFRADTSTTGSVYKCIWHEHCVSLNNIYDTELGLKYLDSKHATSYYADYQLCKVFFIQIYYSID